MEQGLPDTTCINNRPLTDSSAAQALTGRQAYCTYCTYWTCVSNTFHSVTNNSRNIKYVGFEDHPHKQDAAKILLNYLVAVQLNFDWGPLYIYLKC